MTLALGGIAVVLGAVFASMGFLALLGLPSSLIILEVVPFLVLAVGADNIFIFVQEYQVGATGGPWRVRGGPRRTPLGAGIPAGYVDVGGSLGSPCGGALGFFGFWGPHEAWQHPWVGGPQGVCRGHD